MSHEPATFFLQNLFAKIAAGSRKQVSYEVKAR